MSYLPLNIKTSYSLLSSLVDIPKLIKLSKQYQIKALAITDRNMGGVFEFYYACKAAKIKPVLGLELSLMDKTIFLYAMNYQGYQNLVKILAEQQPELTLKVLKAHCNNLICLLPFASVSLLDELKPLFPNLYLGYATRVEREALIKVDERVIFVNEVLYLNQGEDLYLKYLYLIRDGKKMEALKDYNIDDNHYLLPPSAVLELSPAADLKRMDALLSQCEVNFQFNADLLPQYPLPKGMTAPDYLKALCKKGLEKRLAKQVTLDYIKRLQTELDIIIKMGFSDYFLVVWDFVKYAKNNEILIGPGRGSSAGSLVAYCLGITEVDPLVYNLLFERFLNKERLNMPDIDLDFDAERREEVVKYVINKYGKKHAVPIITFVTLGGKQVIRDVGRILDVPGPLLNQLSQHLNPNISLSDNYKDGKLKKVLAINPLLRQVYQISIKLEGLKRQFSVHAAGVVISKLPLDYYLPLQPYHDYYLTGVTMDYLESLGLLKIDFLGLKNLTLINEVLTRVQRQGQFNQIPLNDKLALDLFKRGLTAGIFQFESRGMVNFIQRLKPSNFEEIVAAVALFRPGPMDNIELYRKRKLNKMQINYYHPSLKPVLEPTYGIIVYQEQIMQIAHIMAGYTLGEADVLRRAMSKKEHQIFEQERHKFIKRGQARGYSLKTVTAVYQLIIKFANYGFNRAHAVAYALISYRMAFLKAHYPGVFLSSLLTSALGNETKTKLYRLECKALKVPLLAPEINLSDLNFKNTDAGIRYSLGAIKNIGGVICKAIVKERQQGDYLDFFNFVGRTYGKIVDEEKIKALIDAGCFSSFGNNQKTLHHNLTKAISYAEIYQKVENDLIEPPIMDVCEDFSEEELRRRELAVLGVNLRFSIWDKINKEQLGVITSIDLPAHEGQEIALILQLETMKTVMTKHQEQMAFIDGYDELGLVKIVLFPQVYKKYQNFKVNGLCLIKGKVEKRLSTYQVNLSKMEQIKIPMV